MSSTTSFVPMAGAEQEVRALLLDASLSSSMSYMRSIGVCAPSLTKAPRYSLSSQPSPPSPSPLLLCMPRPRHSDEQGGRPAHTPLLQLTLPWLPSPSLDMFS